MKATVRMLAALIITAGAIGCGGAGNTALTPGDRALQGKKSISLGGIGVVVARPTPTCTVPTPVPSGVRTHPTPTSSDHGCS